MTDLLQPAQLAALAKLRVPFSDRSISRLPKGLKKGEPKRQCRECGGYHEPCAVHLDYVGHAALTDRLLDADPAWTWAPVATTPEGFPRLTPDGGLWIHLTVAGVTRLGYGAADGKTGGDAIKELIGDALRNAAMRFGAALDLWHKGELHAEGWAPEVPAPPVSEAAQMLAPLTTRSDASEAAQMLVREKPAGAACNPNSFTLPKAVATVAKTTEQVYHSPPVITHRVPRETLADDPAALRAEIRRLIGELGAGALVEAKKSIGLEASATPTDAQREEMLTYLEQRAEMAAHERQIQESEASMQEEVTA